MNRCCQKAQSDDAGDQCFFHDVSLVSVCSCYAE
jgi:hypothetical protein